MYCHKVLHFHFYLTLLQILQIDSLYLEVLNFHLLLLNFLLVLLGLHLFLWYDGLPGGCGGGSEGVCGLCVYPQWWERGGAGVYCLASGTESRLNAQPAEEDLRRLFWLKIGQQNYLLHHSRKFAILT